MNLTTYDTGRGDRPVFWLHGTPNIGEPPAPLFPLSDPLGIRWLGYDRPGYGGSPRRPGRDVASAAADVAAVADSYGIDRFAVVGHSGGGPHALACAALLPDRVTATVAISSPAPYDGEDWFAGMAPGAEAGLRAAVAGRAAKEEFEAHPPDIADIGFGPRDWAELTGDWSWFGRIVTAAQQTGPGPVIDDDLATVGPWGFDPAAIAGPLLILHGAADRMIPPAHARRLAARCPTAVLRVVPGEGHVSVLTDPDWLAWLP